MDGLDAHRLVIDKWAKGLFALAGLKLLLVCILLAQGYAAPADLLDPAIILVLIAAIHSKTSRASSAILIAYCLWNIADHIPAISQGQPFPESFAYGNETAWLILAIDTLVALAAARCAIEAIHFHRSADTRVVWRNIAIVTFTILAYAGAFIILAGLFGDVLPGKPSRESQGLIVILLTILAIVMAIWRKLPGIIGTPVVASKDKDSACPPLGKGAETQRLVMLAAAIERTTVEGDYIVSPIGILGKAYRLTAEQFDSYMARQKKRVNKGAWAYALMPMAIVVGSFSGHFFSGSVLQVVVAVTLPSLAVFIAWTLWRQLQSFRREYPDVQPVERPAGGRMETFLLGFGAGAPGKAWHMGLSIIVFLFFAFATVIILLQEPINWAIASFAGGLALFGLLSPLAAITGKRRFRARYGCPLTAENLLAVRSGGQRHSVGE